MLSSLQRPARQENNMSTTDTLPSKPPSGKGKLSQKSARPKRADKRHSGQARPVTKSLQEYGRGIAGGILFSLPLLYTMEVWWAGFSVHPWRLAAAVLTTLI